MARMLVCGAAATTLPDAAVLFATRFTTELGLATSTTKTGEQSSGSPARPSARFPRSLHAGGAAQAADADSDADVGDEEAKAPRTSQ
jgi:hypothetical protein